MQFDKFDAGVFLRDFWQKQPLLIRNPWTGWSNPLDPDELAGLACEEGVEARLIAHAGATWRAEFGPFTESRFAQPGKDPWTLLVQAVDHHVPEVAALIDPFRFIPNWRIDDVMVSYATDGGGVGPHFDRYDVFLIQGLGKRRWQVGAACDATSELVPHDDLCLLANFEVAREWILEPGDILYLPPGIAHNGVAVGDDCMTYSIGFRAPARAELIAHWCDHLLGGAQEDERYEDPDLRECDNPGEISEQAITGLHAMITREMADPAAFARWFGKYNSTRKYPDIDWRPQEPINIAQLRQGLAGDVPLLRNPASRFSFVRQQGQAIQLFVDGQCFECADDTASFAEQLCGPHPMAAEPKLLRSAPTLELLVTLFNQGSVAFADEI